jgi:hypothetical protein
MYGSHVTRIAAYSCRAPRSHAAPSEATIRSRHQTNFQRKKRIRTQCPQTHTDEAQFPRPAHATRSHHHFQLLLVTLVSCWPLPCAARQTSSSPGVCGHTTDRLDGRRVAVVLVAIAFAIIRTSSCTRPIAVVVRVGTVRASCVLRVMQAKHPVR